MEIIQTPRGPRIGVNPVRAFTYSTVTLAIGLGTCAIGYQENSRIEQEITQSDFEQRTQIEQCIDRDISLMQDINAYSEYPFMQREERRETIEELTQQHEDNQQTYDRLLELHGHKWEAYKDAKNNSSFVFELGLLISTVGGTGVFMYGMYLGLNKLEERFRPDN